MPLFSPASKAKLSTCHPDLQRLFYEVIKYYDCTVIEGHRSKEAQDKAVAEKKSKKAWPTSKHNFMPARAVDVAPYPINWDTKEHRRFYHFAGFVKATAIKLGIEIRWGGDWDSDLVFSDERFNDLPHFELK